MKEKLKCLRELKYFEEINKTDFNFLNYIISG